MHCSTARDRGRRGERGQNEVESRERRRGGYPCLGQRHLSQLSMQRVLIRRDHVLRIGRQQPPHVERADDLPPAVDVGAQRQALAHNDAPLGSRVGFSSATAATHPVPRACRMPCGRSLKPTGFRIFIATFRAVCVRKARARQLAVVPRRPRPFHLTLRSTASYTTPAAPPPR